MTVCTGNATAMSLGRQAALAMEATLAPDVTKVNAPQAEEGLLEVTDGPGCMCPKRRCGFSGNLVHHPFPPTLVGPHCPSCKSIAAYSPWFSCQLGPVEATFAFISMHFVR